MRLRILLLTFLFAACQNLEGVKPTQRSTFIYFYGGPENRVGKMAVPSGDGGYLIAGNIVTDNDTKMVIIKTDGQGKTIWEKIIGGGSVSALSVVTDGYIIAGDSIKHNPESQQVTELINTKARIIKMDVDGNIKVDYSYGGALITPTDTLQIDFTVDAITFDASNRLIVLGTYTKPNDLQRVFVSSNNITTLDTLWINKYELLDKNYVNGQSVNLSTTGDIVWTSSILDNQQSFNKSYVALPYAEPRSSSFTNNSFFGVNEAQLVAANDIKPNILGFAIVGSYAAPDGTNPSGVNSNIFFVRADQAGNIDLGTAKYYDGYLSKDNKSVDTPGQSSTEDYGQALASTSDSGFIIAGTMVSTTTRGKGDKDIWLIKLDPFGTMTWNKLIGGTFAESASSIQQTSDGGYLICGTHTYSGLSQILIVKTDGNGDVNN